MNVFAHELSRHSSNGLQPAEILGAVQAVHERCSGAYAVVALIVGQGIVAFRDPHGIRPAVLGIRETELGIERTGLEIDDEDSRRVYRGEPSDDGRNNRRLLELLGDRPPEERGARFVCVLAVAGPGGILAPAITAIKP